MVKKVVIHKDYYFSFLLFIPYMDTYSLYFALSHSAIDQSRYFGLSVEH